MDHLDRVPEAQTVRQGDRIAARVPAVTASESAAAGRECWIHTADTPGCRSRAEVDLVFPRECGARVAPLPLDTRLGMTRCFYARCGSRRTERGLQWAEAVTVGLMEEGRTIVALLPRPLPLPGRRKLQQGEVVRRPEGAGSEADHSLVVLEDLVRTGWRDADRWGQG